MPTQKTGTTPQQKPAASTTDETITVGGRQMRRVNMGEFANQAFDGIVGASLGDPKPTEHETDPQQRAAIWQDLHETSQDPALMREFLLEASMIRSREREKEIA